MKRGWLVVLAIALPVVALQLSVVAMETAPSSLEDDRDDGPGPLRAAPIPRAEAEPAEPARLRSVPWSFETGAMHAVQIVEPPGGLPSFLAVSADTHTQFYRGYAHPGWLVFGLYADGTLRMTDVDGRSFEGRLIGTSATLRENDATSSFEVAFTVAGSNGRRRVAFQGGRHDAQELEIEPIRQAPAASR